MDQKLIDALPVGNFSFEAIRKKNRIYVDKTKFLAQIASTDNRIFLTRPRRFGKSLLVSTLKSLFKNGLKYFDGLEIAKTWDDRTYPVVHLDFSKIASFSDIDEFKEKLLDHLIRNFEAIGFACSGDAFTSLDSWLMLQESRSIVLLIDEYDAPLTHCLDNTTLLNQVGAVFSDFYALVKGNDACWRFVFITGITKFPKLSIFSAMNNLKDISLLSQYGALPGLTEQELTDYFDPYLDNAAAALGLPQQALIAQMERKYGGFCFEDSGKTKVYSPWSILSFLTEPEAGLKNYWIESAGRPSVLLDYFKDHSFNKPEEYFSEKDISIEALSL